MIVIKSSEYELIGYDPEECLWRFERWPSKVGDTLKERLLVGQAKYVDIGTALAYLCNSDGKRVLTPASKRLLVGSKE